MPSRLFVGNLPYDATEEEIRQHFAQAAPVSRVFLPLDRETGRPRGFAFIEYADSSHATAAIAQFNQKPFKDRSLVVNEARPSESRPAGGASGPPGASRGSSFAPPSRERTTPGSSPGRSSDGLPARREAPARPRRRGGGRRASWEEAPKKEPIPEKRRGQIFGGYDDQEDEPEEVDFENFATGLPEDDEDQ